MSQFRHAPHEAKRIRRFALLTLLALLLPTLLSACQPIQAPDVAPDAAAAVQPDQPYPYGSVLVIEVYRTPEDDACNVLLDENNRYQRDALAGIFVMRKEAGYGGKCAIHPTMKGTVVVQE